MGGLYHKVFDFLISAFKVCKVVPSLRVNAFGRVAFGAANECVIDAAEMLFENFGIAQVFGRAFAIELLEPLDKAIAVKNSLDGVVVIDFFFERFGRVGVVFEQVRFPVENGVALFAVDAADEQQVDKAFAEALE